MQKKIENDPSPEEVQNLIEVFLLLLQWDTQLKAITTKPKE